jgi:hypothetical protein
MMTETKMKTEENEERGTMKNVNDAFANVRIVL